MHFLLQRANPTMHISIMQKNNTKPLLSRTTTSKLLNFKKKNPWKKKKKNMGNPDWRRKKGISKKNRTKLMQQLRWRFEHLLLLLQQPKYEQPPPWKTHRYYYSCQKYTFACGDKHEKKAWSIFLSSFRRRRVSSSWIFHESRAHAPTFIFHITTVGVN